jgi:hypothetical protein
VNAQTMPARQLAMLLHQSAAGICADDAAVTLITRHGHFLHQPAFRRIIAAGSSICSPEPAAVIRWRAAIHALDTGRLCCSRSADAMLRIAASLGDDDIPVCLRQALGGLDRRNIALVTAAITAANG